MTSIHLLFQSLSVTNTYTSTRFLISLHSADSGGPAVCLCVLRVSMTLHSTPLPFSCPIYSTTSEAPGYANIHSTGNRLIIQLIYSCFTPLSLKGLEPFPAYIAHFLKSSLLHRWANADRHHQGSKCGGDWGGFDVLIKSWTPPKEVKHNRSRVETFIFPFYL